MAVRHSMPAIGDRVEEKTRIIDRDMLWVTDCFRKIGHRQTTRKSGETTHVFLCQLGIGAPSADGHDLWTDGRAAAGTLPGTRPLYRLGHFVQYLIDPRRRRGAFTAVFLWSFGGGSPFWVGVYLSAMAVLTLIALLLLQETKHVDIEA